MATTWYVQTSASEAEVIGSAQRVFFVKPKIGERAKVWSKAAQLQSNIRWKGAEVPGAQLAAAIVSGGVREMVGSRGGSMIGTTIALSVEDQGPNRLVQVWLSTYNTYFGINQQSDLVKSYAKQIAADLVAHGSVAVALRSPPPMAQAPISPPVAPGPTPGAPVPPSVHIWPGAPPPPQPVGVVLPDLEMLTPRRFGFSAARLGFNVDDSGLVPVTPTSEPLTGCFIGAVRCSSGIDNGKRARGGVVLDFVRMLDGLGSFAVTSHRLCGVILDGHTWFGDVSKADDRLVGWQLSLDAIRGAALRKATTVQDGDALVIDSLQPPTLFRLEFQQAGFMPPGDEFVETEGSRQAMAFVVAAICDRRSQGAHPREQARLARVRAGEWADSGDSIVAPISGR